MPVSKPYRKSQSSSLFKVAAYYARLFLLSLGSGNGWAYKEERADGGEESHPDRIPARHDFQVSSYIFLLSSFRLLILTPSHRRNFTFEQEELKLASEKLRRHSKTKGGSTKVLLYGIHFLQLGYRASKAVESAKSFRSPPPRETLGVEMTRIA